ncbi:DUF4880 domain-containing protein [Nitrospirillum sp. BR 11164]|uniref:DUF4880 domain-containing protein n=1 Tax=Nitrospirillum sp. BR 11164 TaxID=3104324 RepID=UPI002AFE7C59|nr:DUF4880 domain-containing protein [Nitrospirillum sp. BR 11164]MEA1651384.1 DUF4880 domain-containing protein [Nitrospirillum sp. BR 11164]
MAERSDVWSPSPVEEAARWALRRADAPLTPEEEAAFQAWLAADPGHRDSYQALHATLEDPALTEAMAGLKDAPRAARPPARLPLPRAIPQARRLLPGLALAACAALVLVVLWPNIDRYMATPLHYETAGGQGRTVTLPDGTALNLNGDTVVEARLGHGHRWLTLSRGKPISMWRTTVTGRSKSRPAAGPPSPCWAPPSTST